MSFDHRFTRAPQDPALRRLQYGRVRSMYKPSLTERFGNCLRAMVRKAR
ncbi:MAG: hypothetical protein AAFZ11_00880 [Pseudomonadota bacterium]